MLAQEFLDNTYTAYRGKIQSRTPTWGTDKANIVIAIGNRKIQEWGTDARNKWNSLFETSAQSEIGTVTTAGSTTLTGTGTFFTDYLVGDKITVNGETERTIDTITSDTVLTVTVAFTTTASSLAFTRSTIVDTTNDLTYKLNRRFFQPSDFAKVVRTDSSIVEYPIVKAQQRSIVDQALYVHGLAPKKITFAQKIDSGLDGGVLTVPGYYSPAPILLPTDVIPVDDPNWLVYITASELARNDPAKEDNFPTLAGMANDLFTKMSNANADVGFAQPNSIVNLMPSIGDQTGESWY
jgi:hypothetical protein